MTVSGLGLLQQAKVARITIANGQARWSSIFYSDCVGLSDLIYSIALKRD